MVRSMKITQGPLSLLSRVSVHTMNVSMRIRMPVGFEPYPNQKQMITHMLRAMDERKNAIIESPTGSGESSFITIGFPYCDEWG